MRSTFFGLEIMRSSLQAQRLGLEVTAHNISNANTPGYSRQVINLKAASPYPFPGANPGAFGQLGTGVEVTEVKRLRNQFVESQIRKETQSLGYWDNKARNVKQIEMIINEPTEIGLSASFERYWQAWQNLAGEAEDMGHRAPVAQRAAELSTTFRDTKNQLQSLQNDADHTIAVNAKQINGLAYELALINKQIAKVSLLEQAPNDLLDKQDKLLKELSELTNITVLEGRQQTVTVQIHGTSLVDYDNVNEIVIIPPKEQSEMTQLIWSKGQSPVSFTNGKIKALFDVRDSILPDVIASLDEMAHALITETNRLHQNGYGLNLSTGRSFFSGSNASDIKVIDSILEDPENIAASVRFDAPGNGDNALAIADIFKKPILKNNTANMESFFDSLVAKLGVMGQESDRTVLNQEALVQHLNSEQNQYAAVSIDEEMANMIKYQHAYAAAARMISTLDEALETIITRMGVVGR